jgi:hypothetical protein
MITVPMKRATNPQKIPKWATPVATFRLASVE